MGKEEIIIADYRTSSHWFSCDLIKSKVLASYGSSEIWFQGEGLLRPKGDTLVIADHRWLDNESLNSLTKENRKLKIFFHVYGDLTIKLPLFFRTWEILKKFDISLVVLSNPHRKLLETICPDTIGKIIVRPYEADPEAFKFSDSARDLFRKKYLLEGQVLGYAGRICRQKGILELMEAFLKVKTPDAKLLLTGPLSPHPFWQFDLENKDEAFVSQFTKLLALGKDSIFWIKNILYEEMPGFYSAIDEFVSPSYFHDEDFGMSVSEALAVGVPCLISRWGGYLRFENNPRVRFINLKETEQGVTLNHQSLISKLQKQVDPSIRLQWDDHSSLTPDQVRILRETPAFLKAPDGQFNHEIYKILYGNYIKSDC